MGKTSFLKFVTFVGRISQLVIELKILTAPRKLFFKNDRKVVKDDTKRAYRIEGIKAL